MKHIPLYLVVILFVSACSKEEGEPFIKYRNADQGTMKTLKGVYLNMHVARKDSIIKFEDDPTTAQVISYFYNSDTSIVQYGHCWSIHEKPLINQDSISFYQGSPGEGNVQIISPMIDLRILQKYYVRAYIITKHGEKRDTAYGENKNFITDYIGNIWVKQNDITGVRRGAVAFNIDTVGYVGTGESNTGICYDDFYRYDPKLNRWTQLANLGTDFSDDKRLYAVGFGIDGKGYIGLGEANTGEQKDDFWEYDPDLGVWSKFAFLGSKRSKAIAFTIGNNAYVGLGEYGATVNSRSALNDFYKLDPASKTWTQQESFPDGKRTDAAAFAIGANGYIMGGADENGNLLNDLWIFSPGTGSSDGDWYEAEVFPGAARKSAAAFSVNGIGYIVMGQDADGVFLRDMWSYEPEPAKKWTKKQDFKGDARIHAVGFSVFDRGYIGTGYDDNDKYRDDIYEYIPEGLDTK